MQIDEKEARQIAIVRKNLETLAVSLLIESVNKKDIEALKRICKECNEYVQAGDVGSFLKKIVNFILKLLKEVEISTCMRC